MAIFNQFFESERTRCECFKLLAACFYQPQKELFLEEKTLENLSGLLTRVCPGAALPAERMRDALLRYGNEELLVEYAKLFVGPFELKAPPYGSVYLEQNARLMGDSTLEVQKMYQEEGLSLDADFNDLPDHVTAELEFMYYLSFREVEALEKNDNEQAARFLNRQEHFLGVLLRSWVEPFCEKIRQGTENDYYRALADCLSAFISSAGRADAVPEELRAGLVRQS